MSKQHINITQTFDAPVETVFKALTDHENFGRLINSRITRVVDADGEDKNGLGSVRQIRSFPLPPFEESVIAFEPGRLMEYTVSKGSPVKNHKGRMVFSEENGKTLLDYTIFFETKLPFFWMGPIIKQAIEKPMRKGFKELASQYKT